MNNSDRLRDLLRTSDYRAIRELIDSDESGELAAELHAIHMAGLETNSKQYDYPYWQAALEEILSADKKEVKKQTQLFIMKRRWWIAAAAASILLFSYFLFFNKSGKEPATLVQNQIRTDVLPGGNKAVLTLGNGTKIGLDSAGNGALALQGNTSVLKIDSGRLAYNISTEKPSEVFFNTLSTPRGGQYQLTLSDGTKVWLNAASSITYPTSFAGSERKVTITGEVYFDVVHNATKPFIVASAGQEIRVLGTQFNVNAYPDEAVVRTTLLQGSVKITETQTHQSLVISPGQQAVLNGDQFSLVKNVIPDEVVAWKEGNFHFESADLKTILRQFSRWYDVDVVYEGTPTGRKFFGIVKRSNSLQRVLEMLKDNNIEYRIEGNKLIVKSS